MKTALLYTVDPLLSSSVGSIFKKVWSPESIALSAGIIGDLSSNRLKAPLILLVSSPRISRNLNNYS